MSERAYATRWGDASPAEGDTQEAADLNGWEAPEPRRALAPLLVGILLLVAGLGWIVSLGVAVARAGALEPLRLAAWIGLGSGPLALLAILYLLFVRTGRSEATAYSRAAARLRADSINLANTLTLLDERIAAARASLDEQGSALSAIGSDSSARLEQAAADLRGQADDLARLAGALDNATSTARADLGVLLTDLPQAEALTSRLSAVLREAGSGAESHTRALTGLLGQLEAQARAADETSGGAAARLAAQLDRIEASAAAADRRIEDAAGALGRTIDEAMAAASDAIENSRSGIAEQSRALTVMVEQGRASLDLASEDAARALGERLEQVMSRIEAAGQALRQQDQAAHRMFEQLEQAIAAVEQRFAGLGDSGAEHTADLAESMVALAGHAEAIGRSLGLSGERADAVLARVRQLRENAEASSTTICETIPAALSRIRLHAEQSLQAITAAGSHSEALDAAAASTAGRIAEAEAMLVRQRDLLGEVGGEAAERLTHLVSQTETLEQLLARADAATRELADGASPALVDALEKVRDIAGQASDHARDALFAAIPRAAQGLGESAARAMVASLRDVGQQEMAALTAVSEEAVAGARQAAEHLNRQLLTIAETSTAIEARIEANRTDTEQHDEEAFARRFGLMIEALNSTAIDVARIMSKDVPESAWAAYLKGERGIFTRRAVRLLDGVEARTIADHYGENGEFRELVNRYVADFEALLRRTLAVRDGGPIATTLLSSDVGKLYVALAQAIERLR